MRTKTLKLSRGFQYGTRIAILVLATTLAVLHQINKSNPNAHVFCPFGGLESLYQFLANGGYLRRIMPATMILFGGAVILTILLNRAFCGWICPLGTLQMLADKIARFFKVKRIQVPQKLERSLSLLKYGVLALTLYFTWKVGDLVYEAYDPWAAYAHLGGDWAELTDRFLIGLIFLGVAIIGSIWIPYNFCRYFCPMGAFLSILSKFSPTKLHVMQKTCTSCQKCANVCPIQIDVCCPVQIDVCAQPKVSSSQCLSCGDCVVACPQSNCLEPRMAGTFRMKWVVYGVAALVLFFTPVLLSKQAGAWKSGTTATEKVTDSAGMKNPYYIRGSMGLKEACDEFQIPLDRFIMTFNLPMDIDTNMRIKDVATAAGVSMRDLKEFAAQYVMQQNPGMIFDDSGEGMGRGDQGEH